MLTILNLALLLSAPISCGSPVPVPVEMTGLPLSARDTGEEAGDNEKAGNERRPAPLPGDFPGRVDLAVPESPGFTVLGVSPDNVIRPSNAKDFAVSLLYGLDPRGNVHSGVAVDARPYMLARGPSFTLADYRENRGKRALARIGVSFATARGRSDQDRSTRFSLGVRWTPFDKGDFRRDETLDECYGDAPGEPVARPEEVDPNPREREEAENRVRVSRCLRDAEARNWNQWIWEIGVAGHHVSETDIRDDGMSFWTSLGLPASRFGNLILHLRAYEHLLVARSPPRRLRCRGELRRADARRRREGPVR
jgi:hypothetical protein